MTDDENNPLARTADFSRNTELEKLLRETNSLLWISEQKALEDYRHPEFPVVLIFGPLRSGTTLFMQWLANSGLFAYPTNLLSRFYQAPILGAKIQLLLTDPRYSFRDELGEFLQCAEYESENGKTKGVLAPNEFWYFWRRFLSDPNRDVWTDDELCQSMDKETMLAELSGMMDVLQKPFAAKGMLFNYNIPFLDSVFSKALFVQIRRDPVPNVASVLEARRRQHGSQKNWYSFRIPEYEKLKSLEPISQVAGQVHYINKAVSHGIAKVDPKRKMVVQYEDFCADPQSVFDELARKIGKLGSLYEGPRHFKVTRESAIPDQAAIEKAVSHFSNNH